MPRRRPKGELQAEALAAIRAGASDEDVAKYVGVDLATFRAWMATKWGDGVDQARAERAILAAGTLQEFLQARRIPAEVKTGVAQRILEDRHAEMERDRLKRLTEGY